MANETARGLRKRMTPHEVVLWSQLRELKRIGFHFRRQAPIEGFIVDFACYAARLVIEVDGGQHGDSTGVARDEARDAKLRENGFTVLRVWNNDVKHDLDNVMMTIHRRTPPGGRFATATLPVKGRDEAPPYVKRRSLG